MASSLLFNWIAAYMYEGDAPLAERRAAALALDRDLLRDLLGAEELRELLDPDVLADVELRTAVRRRTDRRARSADELHDVLRKVGDLTAAEIDLRCRAAARIRLRRWRLDPAVARGEARDRDRRRRSGACRCSRRRSPLPRRVRVCDPAGPADGVHRAGRPAARGARRSLRAHPRPVRHRRRGGRFDAPVERIAGALAALEGEERVVIGEFRPDGVSASSCDVDVLRQLRRRSLASLRREVEPVEQEALARFLPAWHEIPAQRRGAEALVESLGHAVRCCARGVDDRGGRAPHPRGGLPPRHARRIVHRR